MIRKETRGGIDFGKKFGRGELGGREFCTSI
jgi:hypothetical protein